MSAETKTPPPAREKFAPTQVKRIVEKLRQHASEFRRDGWVFNAKTLETAAVMLDELAARISAERLCVATTRDADGWPFICNLNEGHEGDHEAHGHSDKPEHKWAQS